MKNLQTSIGWADFTINFWKGCDKVDSDCRFCYMYRDQERYGHSGKDLVKISSKTIRDKIRAANELHADRQYRGDNTPVRIFLSSWTDVFLKRVPVQWRDEMWSHIVMNPHLIFMILTKRPEHITAHTVPEGWLQDGAWKNVWIGTSVGSGEPKKMLRIVNLLKAKQRFNFKVAFASLEPLIGPVNLRHIDADGYGDPDWCQIDALTGRHTDMARPCPDVPKLDWVIVGGESGNETGKYRYRPCELDWIKSIVIQCQMANVPVYVKQMGTYLAKKMGLKDRHGGDPEEFNEYVNPNFYGTVASITRHPSI